jgi:hypothetical protein
MQSAHTSTVSACYTPRHIASTAYVAKARGEQRRVRGTDTKARPQHAERSDDSR